MLFGVNLDIGIPRHGELASRELLGVHIGDLDKGIRSRGRWDDLNGNDHVHANGSGENIVQRVVDVFADDVDAARTARNEIRAMAVQLVELGNQAVPSSLVLWRDRLGGSVVRCINFRNGLRLRDKRLRGSRHGGAIDEGKRMCTVVMGDEKCRSLGENKVYHADTNHLKATQDVNNMKEGQGEKCEIGIQMEQWGFHHHRRPFEIERDH